MKNSCGCGIIETNKRWLLGPRCRKQKLARLGPNPVVKDLDLYCRRCNSEVNIAIEPEP